MAKRVKMFTRPTGPSRKAPTLAKGGNLADKLHQGSEAEDDNRLHRLLYNQTPNTLPSGKVVDKQVPPPDNMMVDQAPELPTEPQRSPVRSVSPVIEVPDVVYDPCRDDPPGPPTASQTSTSDTSSGETTSGTSSDSSEADTTSPSATDRSHRSVEVPIPQMVDVVTIPRDPRPRPNSAKRTDKVEAARADRQEEQDLEQAIQESAEEARKAKGKAVINPPPQ